MIPEQPLESHSGLCHHAGVHRHVCAYEKSHDIFYVHQYYYVLYKKLQDDNLALRVSIEPTS